MVQYKQAMGLRRHSGQIVKDMSLIVVGSLLFSVSMNCIILPSGMYSGGFLGIAQLLRMVLLSVFPSLQSVGDVAGIIYFLLNVPLLILAWSRFGHLFFAKTALCGHGASNSHNVGLHDLTTPKTHSPCVATRLVGSYPTFSPLP